jgi:hypothetical protein
MALLLSISSVDSALANELLLMPIDAVRTRLSELATNPKWRPLIDDALRQQMDLSPLEIGQFFLQLYGHLSSSMLSLFGTMTQVEQRVWLCLCAGTPAAHSYLVAIRRVGPMHVLTSAPMAAKAPAPRPDVRFPTPTAPALSVIMRSGVAGATVEADGYVVVDGASGPADSAAAAAAPSQLGLASEADRSEMYDWPPVYCRVPKCSDVSRLHCLQTVHECPYGATCQGNPTHNHLFWHPPPPNAPICALSDVGCPDNAPEHRSILQHPCRHGLDCRIAQRSDHVHRMLFQHPPPPKPTKLPKCKDGVSCPQINSFMHMEAFRHPCAHIVCTEESDEDHCARFSHGRLRTFQRFGVFVTKKLFG